VILGLGVEWAWDWPGVILGGFGVVLGVVLGVVFLLFFEFFWVGWGLT